MQAESIVGGRYDMKNVADACTGSILEDAARVKHFPVIPGGVFVTNAVKYRPGIRKAYRVEFIAERAGGDLHKLEFCGLALLRVEVEGETDGVMNRF
jgi:hypothetical protein